MGFQNDLVKINRKRINNTIRKKVETQRRLWYCTFIINVFSLLNSSEPISSFVDSFIIPFPDDSDFNEKIVMDNNGLPSNNKNNNIGYQINDIEHINGTASIKAKGRKKRTDKKSDYELNLSTYSKYIK